MLLEWILLAGFGICAGGMIAAGVFAFLAIIGIYPRIIGKSKTKQSIMQYETCMIVGGTLGNLCYLFEVPWHLSQGLPGVLLLIFFGIGSGSFVGCLVMSLSETLKVIPVMNRRIRLSVGLPYVILAFALGKLAGSLLYFFKGIGA